MGANFYLLLKLLHIFVAIVALGTSAGLGIVLEFYGNDPKHGSFVLRVIERLIVLVVIPGYVIMLATGLWMASLAWPFTASWIQWALGLWLIGAACLAYSLASIRKRRWLQSTEGHSVVRGGKTSIINRLSDSAFGLVVVAILYLMVFKPWSR